MCHLNGSPLETPDVKTEQSQRGDGNLKFKKCCIDNRERLNIYWTVKSRHGWADLSMGTRIEIDAMLHPGVHLNQFIYSKAASPKFFSKSPS